MWYNISAKEVNMAVITQIKTQAKDKTRANIYLDGVFACGLSLSCVFSYRLNEGEEISPERLNEIQAESEKEAAFDKALNYISATMKTEKDVRDYLKKKGYLPAVEEYVIEKMISYGYIDDREYARAYVKGCADKSGKNVIAQKLKLKGINQSDIDSALEELPSQEGVAKAILTKYMRGKEFTKENLYKAFRHLMGKGFDYDTAKSALKDYGEEYEDL